ncbi:MAG: DUF192 domain-containing protein [Actinobacteria bacterium]|nr:DUF192 domain-containing protein [Actinomycetota bacterium]
MGKQPPLRSAWLVSDGRVLASADVADNPRARRVGLLGKSTTETALVIEPCSWVHTLGMRFALDVAYVDRDGVVVKVSHLSPWRVGAPVRGSKFVIEAASGSFERWGLRVGSPIEVRSS